MNQIDLKNRKESAKFHLPTILASISIKRGKVHGYQAMQDIRKARGVSLGSSTVYPKLQEMADNGYFTMEWEMGKSKKPIKVYTPTGKIMDVINQYEIEASEMQRLLPDKTEIGVLDNTVQTIPRSARKILR
jgi:DNA-binding PadR family transcriptional regulator